MIFRKTRQHVLDPKKTLYYFVDHIKSSKTLSKQVIDKIDFNIGRFYTILPCTADLNRLFDFDSGGIIPSTSCAEKQSDIENSFAGLQPTQVLTMDWEFSKLIYRFLKKTENGMVVVENYNMEFSSRFCIIKNVSVVPDDLDVYYFLSSANSLEEIYQTVRKSNQVWHFLAVFTKIDGVLPLVLDKNILDEICRNIKSVVTSAYDGESYVFWEPIASIEAEKIWEENIPDLNINNISKSHPLPRHRFLPGDKVLIRQDAPKSFCPGEIGLIISIKETEHGFALREDQEESANRYVVQLGSGEKLEILELWLMKPD